ncbi:peroxisomal biogenesis factor 11 [Metschnikowia bicuspidata var. bicuspidata NRRL YB-4993]|uniref:Peroxisomal biogenesis factor 11 n=1 Tax=Metschnikowia bicuspidata var. bicuspidata NRRL YB-4993 TaxID=869754 RepID=A0A1A0H906_9ASCO|nr:peroxisomal biogenesis factor 11 [Metschnikowia bicuspidata var. bicuspidata NRRL YB-4993]OBA20485.1 peroxisomal biogenesis factor 11 [Metschnikowia bicuspidata var. bicuspidata NRRL YB-4993]
MVADCIIYHPTLTKLLKFIDSTPKREKSFRLVAYLSRFLGYYLQRRGYSAELVRKFADLKQHATLIRKGMRFLKPLNHLQAASKAYDNKLMDLVLLLTTVARNLGYAGYLALDQVTFFKMLGLVDKRKYTWVPVWAARCWLAGLVAGVVHSLRTYQINRAKMAAVEEAGDTCALQGKVYAAKRKLVWDALDMFVCLNTLNYLHFSEGDVGLAGAVTSLMGLKDLWAAT